MSDPRIPPDESTADGSGSRSVAGEELLPPVEPPTAGFILRLFVVPAVIVLLIVGVSLTISWLVHRTRPEDLVLGLQGSGVYRWQRASELADILHSNRFPEFRRSHEAATNLARILRRDIEAAGSEGGMSPEDINLRDFLCRALGEFEVNEGIDVLLLASETNRDPAERWVRRGAIQAIAVRAHNLRQLDPPMELEHPQLEATLLRLAEDSDSLIRSETAYALGRVATPACVQRLEIMVGDPHADTRYNAAVGLAHLGNVRAIETLAEMLEPVLLASVLEEVIEEPLDPTQLRVHKRGTIIHNAILGAIRLAAQNRQADLSPVVESLQQIVGADEETLQAAYISRAAVSEARRALEVLPKGN